MKKYSSAASRFEDGDLDYFELDDYESEEGSGDDSEDEDSEESEEDDSDDDDGFCLWRGYEDQHKRHVSYCPRCDEKSYILSVDPYCSSCGWDSLLDGKT